MARDNDDDDLQLEPMHKGRASTIVAGVLVVAAAAGVATFVNMRFKRTRRVDSVARTASAWAQLRRCLVGDQLHGRERPTTLIRRIEITLPRGQRDLPEAERLARYPYRCATYASVMTHALFDADSDEPSHRLLATVVSRAASALEQGALRTGANDPSAYLDELFTTAELANLPPGAPATAPLPPTAGRPLTVPRMDALTAGVGSGTFVASDGPTSNTLRVVLGQTQRTLCVFAGTTDRATTLTHAHCAQLPASASAPMRLEPVPGDDDAVSFVRLANGPAPGDVYLAEAGIAPYAHASVGPWSGTGGVFSTFVVLAAPTAPTPPAAPAPPHAAIATPVPTPTWSFERVRGGASPSRVDVTFPVDEAHRTAPLLLGDLALVAVRTEPPAAAASTGASPDASTPDAALPDASDVAVAATDAAPPSADSGASQANASGRLMAASIAAAEPPVVAFAPVADVVAPDREQPLLACRAGHQLAVAVRGAWHRTSVLFYRDGRWSTPVDGIAHPGSFTCRADEATFTWLETVGRRRVHQLRCTPTRCTPSEAIPPIFDGDALPVVTDLDGQVVLLATPGPGHGLQLVRAPIDRLAGTDPVVLLDDGEHGGLEVAPAISVLSRGGAAVVIVNAAAEPYTSYAIRIDPSGEFRAVRQD